MSVSTCPACKSAAFVAEECEDDEFGDAYTAQLCTACGWRSDAPPISIAGPNEGNCEGCRLPIGDGDFVLRYGDGVVTHHACPTGAIA